MFLGSTVRLVRGADNLTAIYERIVLNISQPCRTPRPVTEIALILLFFSASGSGSTQPREYNLGATWKKK
jgi:hypothetical protein